MSWLPAWASTSTSRLPSLRSLWQVKTFSPTSARVRCCGMLWRQSRKTWLTRSVMKTWRTTRLSTIGLRLYDGKTCSQRGSLWCTWGKQGTTSRATTTSARTKICTTGSTAMQMNSTLSTLAGGLRKSTDSGCGCSFARALAAAGSTKSTSALAASPVSKKPRFRS